MLPCHVCPLIHSHGSVGLSVLIDGDARVKNRSGALIFSKSQSSPRNFNRSYLCEISGSEAPVFHGYIYMTRSVENTSILLVPAGVVSLREARLWDRPTFACATARGIPRPPPSTNLSSSTTSTSTSTNLHHTHDPIHSPTIHHQHLSFSTSHTGRAMSLIMSHLLIVKSSYHTMRSVRSHSGTIRFVWRLIAQPRKYLSPLGGLADLIVVADLIVRAYFV